ncbi:MAG: hypothetical protein P0Y50_01645 [Candidatus Brevundimonas colombiensis]|uniref:DUF1190 domain-containing protein n=1 Tax=Candidatus Brevundimonas colombiensis TaxID=3121376 RepID=A0AAJ5X1K3_9CAUL|nr:hypothetical protein [Brevundimonas sp.]WEK40334.1 MAG: hypothetical protein P0Y50_01645 [Brevundimonas sp.]
MVRRKVVLLTMLGLAGCTTAEPLKQVVATEVPVQCKPFEDYAEFSCWWSADDAPLTHCVLRSETTPACRLGAKAGFYINRGAELARDSQQTSGWIGVKVFQDETGHVGFRAEATTSGYSLRHSSAMATPTGSPSSPTWPRFPAGLEFGPEQVRR